MSEKEVKITYETLFDILRREKNNEGLQSLPEGFFQDTMEYLNDKFNILEESKKIQNSFSIIDQEKTAEDLLSIRKILKELYNRREKKLIKVALDTAMINAPIGNTDSMLDYELELFNKSIKLFRQFRVKVLNNLLEGKQPTHLSGNQNCTDNQFLPEQETQSAEGNFSGGQTPNDEQEEHPQYLPESEENQEQGETQPSENTQTAENTQLQSDVEQGQELDNNIPTEDIKVLFLHDVPQFVGRELEVYGPFDQNSEEFLPKEIANILIEKGQAKILE
ncbi:MAG: hypothetical protein KAQ83_01510 [Nanoarchaeota archaeon]|nr:hypothetical protein [Nanoarchaeota archaeon]